MEQQQQVAGNWLTGGGWVIVVFVGAFVLVAAMAWARAQNKKRTPREEQRTEQATRDLYRKDEPRDR